MARSSSTLMECVVLPLQERVEEWRRSHHTLDKDHTKGKNRSTYVAEGENAVWWYEWLTHNIFN